MHQAMHHAMHYEYACNCAMRQVHHAMHHAMHYEYACNCAMRQVGKAFDPHSEQFTLEVVIALGLELHQARYTPLAVLHPP